MDVYEPDDSDMIEDGAHPSSSFDDTSGAVNHENGSDLPTDSAGGGGENLASIPPKLRKRTKTGCLTCRKRRIKCGEERPICSNCIKSKRHCEGYNQRVIFKAPIGEWPNHPSTVNTLPYHSSLLPGTRPVFRQHQPPAQQ